MILKKKIVLFGASGAGKKVYDWILEQNIGDIEFFLDNDDKKNGLEYSGKKIYSAREFLKKRDFENYYIIITSIYNYDIYNQLIENKFPNSQIITKAILAKWIWKNKNIENFNLSKLHEKKSILFDMSAGFVMGGVETWSYTLAERLEKDYFVKLVSINTECTPPTKFHKYAVILKETINATDFSTQSISEYIDIIVKNLPCTLLCAHIDNFLIAAHIVKKKYPEYINIISIIHGGLQTILLENLYYKDWIDKYFCVSPDSYKCLIEYDIRLKNKVYYKETPVSSSHNQDERVYTTNRQNPIKIAYAARLEKMHKRSDLIIKLIQSLEEKNCNYTLDIAGDGEYYEKIKYYITQQNLTNKVVLKGILEHEKMNEFWLQHDIYVNVSECEGCCVAMLEAMIAGCVPIVTDVFSVRHFVHNKINGYIIKNQDIKSMASKIEELEENRCILEKMGKDAHWEIIVKCNTEDYIEFLMKNIL